MLQVSEASFLGDENLGETEWHEYFHGKVGHKLNVDLLGPEVKKHRANCRGFKACDAYLIAKGPLKIEATVWEEDSSSIRRALVENNYFFP